MRILTGLIATGLAAATVAGCMGETGYPGSSYGYPSTAYNRAPVYYSSNAAYNRGPVYATPYYGTPYATAPSRYGPNGDYDRDGIPNRRDRDANGDGVPDRYQR